MEPGRPRPQDAEFFAASITFICERFNGPKQPMYRVSLQRSPQAQQDNPADHAFEGFVPAEIVKNTPA
jgi:hypothetical protein